MHGRTLFCYINLNFCFRIEVALFVVDRKPSKKKIISNKFANGISEFKTSNCYKAVVNVKTDFNTPPPRPWNWKHHRFFREYCCSLRDKSYCLYFKFRDGRAFDPFYCWVSCFIKTFLRKSPFQTVSNFCQNRGWIQYNLHIILFCDDWRMRQMDCFNEPTGKQFPTLGPLEIWFLELNIFVESHNFHKIKFSTNVFLAFSNTFFKYT